MANSLLPHHIVSIDDFGLDPALDKTILEFAQRGVCDRVSILMNVPGTSETSKKLAALPVLKDIHLHLVSTYEDSARRALFFLRTYTHPSTLGSITRQWEAQILHFKNAFGKYPDGLNSHEHIHLIPKLFLLALQLAQKYHIPFIRLGQQPIPLHSDYRPLLLNLWHTKNLSALEASGLNTSASLYSYNWKLLSRSHKEQTLPKKTEIIFHLQYQADRDFLENN